MPETDLTRAKAIFGEALERSGAARSVYLDEACAGDAALRARVEALLAGAEKDDPFLRRATFGDTDPEPEHPAVSEGPGTRIGPYKLLQKIGEGGFGTVFMAEQERPVQRRVALKIIKLGMDTRAVVARFEQERQALAVLDHPNIAKVLDAGATETGRPYFVMELVKGEPITSYCDQNSLTISQRLELFTQVCAAVQHAHTKGIIHRDLKPSNVLVAQQDGRAAARIIDFGIAKATDRRLTDKTLFTEFHQIIGTPEYMSPEQAGGSLDIDTRSDVYSLGVILYELLAGSTPFDAKRLRSAAYEELRRIIREVEPPRPSTRLSEARETLAGIAARRRLEPRRLAPVLQGELDWIVMKALEKDRARRYESASGLAADVQNYLSGAAVSAAPPTAAYRLRKFVRRNRAAVATGLVVAAALAAGMVVASVGLVQANAARKSEEQQKEIAKSKAAVALAINRFLNGMLERADRGEQGGNPDVKVREVLDTAAQELASGEGPQDPEAREALLETVGRTYQALGLYQEAERHLREALQRKRARLGPAHADLAASIRAVAALLRDADKDVEAEALAQDALGMDRLLLGDEDPVVAEDKAGLAMVLAKRRDFAGATTHFQEALRILRREPEKNREQIAQTLTSFGTVVVTQGEYDRAIALYNEALAIERAMHATEHPKIATLLNNLAWALRLKEDFVGAQQMYEQCLQMRRKLLGPTHPLVGATLNNLGGVLHAAGKLDDAETQFRASLELREKALGEENMSTISSIENLAGVLQDQRRLDDAEKLYLRSLALRRKVLGNEHADVADSLGNLATLRMDRNDMDGAEALLREALPIRRRIAAGKDHPDVVVCLANLGFVLTRKKDYAGAAGMYTEALEIDRRLYPAGHEEIARTLLSLGVVHQFLGDHAAAAKELRETLQIRRSRLAPTDDRLVATVAGLGWSLAELAWSGRGNPDAPGQAAEGEKLLRESLLARTAKLKPDSPLLALTKSMTGGAITSVEACGGATDGTTTESRLARLQEAEKLLTQGYAGLSGAGPAVDPARVKQAAELLVRLYETWETLQPGAGSGAKASEWRTK